MNVSLSNTFEQYINEQISTGKFNNASEVVRDALRIKMQKDEVHSAKLEALRSDINKACEQIERGEYSEFDPQEMLNRVKGKSSK